MSIINETYFTKAEFKLPIDNIDIQSYIDEHEIVVLNDLLGVELAKEFIEGMNEAVPADKWINLANGKYFLNPYSKIDMFAGIAKSIARYVYIQILADLKTFPTDIGVKIGGTENADNYSPIGKQVSMHNRLVHEQITLRRFIDSENEAIPNTYENYKPRKVYTSTNIFNI
jgi:hypothetical protein